MTYATNSPPYFQDTDLQEFSRWAASEFKQIQAALDNLEINGARFSILNNAPPKPQNGDTAYADGINWNPGSGAGLYEYVSDAWSKL